MGDLGKQIETRLQDRLIAVQKALRPNAKPPARRPPYGLVSLGKTKDGRFLTLPERDRAMHCHVIGSTGAGKTNTLEHMIRQDIAFGHGVCVIDPHGGFEDSLYNNLLRWLSQSEYDKFRTIHLVDPGNDSYTTGFNPLRRQDGVDLSVIADATLEAFERAWDEDTKDKPTIRRVLTATFSLLAEQGMTLAEAYLLFDTTDSEGTRQRILEKVEDLYARDVWTKLHNLSKAKFEEEIVGPLNRLYEFTRSKAIRTMVGQTDNVLDLRAAMDESHIVLVNLQGGDMASSKAVQLLGALLVRDLFEQCKRRKNPSRPFYLYIDECHQYLSGDIADILDQARKFGLHAILSHQRFGQLLRAGEDIYSAVNSCTHIKVIMGGLAMDDAKLLAEENLPLDIERPVEALIKPTVVDHERIELASGSEAESHSRTDTTGETDSKSTSHGQSTMSGHSMSSGESAGSAVSVDDMVFGSGQVGLTVESSGTASGEVSVHASGESTAEGVAHATHASRGDTTGTTITHGFSEALQPIFKDLPTAVHGLDNMLYAAARALRDLDIGKACVSMGKSAGIVTVPLVVAAVPKVGLAEFKTRLYAASASSLPMSQAMDNIAKRVSTLRQETAGPGEPEEPEDFTEPI